MAKQWNGGRKPASKSDGGARARMLALAAGAMLVGGLTCITLKLFLVKPARIIQAANATQLYDALPVVILKTVMTSGPLKSLKRMTLPAEDLAVFARSAFPPSWVEGEIVAIVTDVGFALKSGGEVNIVLDLAPIKGDIASAVEALFNQHPDRVPWCSAGDAPGTALCKPQGVSDARFRSSLRTLVPGIVDKIPDNYPLVSEDAAGGIASVQGVLSTLGWAAVLLILGAFGAGFVALNTKEKSTPLLYSTGVGLTGGSVLLLLIVYSIRSSALGGLAGGTAEYEAEVAETLSSFVSSGLGGGFTVSFVVLAVTLLAGGVAIVKAGDKK